MLTMNHDPYGISQYISRKDFLRVVKEIRKKEIGSLDYEYSSKTRSIDYRVMYFSETEVTLAFKFEYDSHEFNIRLKDGVVTAEYLNNVNNANNINGYHIYNMYRIMIYIFKDIVKRRFREQQERLRLFRVGLTDKESTLHKKFSSNKIFDRHLAGLVYSFTSEDVN